ncbi:MAG: hypothetical protein ACJAUH_002655 [Saprospiraceae bacterium]|jgi:hypothetical protein
MKQRILVICTALAIVSLTSFAYANWNNTTGVQKEVACSQEVIYDGNYADIFNKQPNLDLVYKVESRFMTTITKEKLHNARSVIDIFPKEETDRMESYDHVTVAILRGGKEIAQFGQDDKLTKEQLELLQSADYSTNFFVRSNCKIATATGRMYDYDLVYYMTVVPEVQAEFAYGQEALIDYLKSSLEEKASIITADKLKPGRVNFTVTKDGTITDVELESTSGFTLVDDELIESITNMPTIWIPATNSKGKKVAQEFVFFFGLQGC